MTWGFGPRWGRLHKGVDTNLEIGDTLYAAFNGIVRYADYNTGGYGNCVVIRHFNGLETIYAHMSELDVEPGIPNLCRRSHWTWREFRKKRRSAFAFRNPL